jgi:hypothetical protein
MDRADVARYCVAPAGSRADIDLAVDALLARGRICSRDRYVFLPGRQGTILTRRRLAQSSQPAWRSARRWGRIFWMLPFVRMVAITGSLAVDGLEDGGDIDFMIVVQSGRLWLTRALCLAIWRLAGVWGTRLCPNYLVSTDALALQQRTLYAARELAQMLPLHGREVAAQLWAANLWSLDFLPNAGLDESVASDVQSLPLRAIKRWFEWALGGVTGDRIEAWERERKITKLSAQVAGTDESTFSDAVCKHHVHQHAGRVLAQYAARLAALDQLQDEESAPSHKRPARTD